MSRNTSETNHQKYYEFAQRGHAQQFIEQRNPVKLKLISDTLNELNSKIKKLKSLSHTSNLDEIQESIQKLPNIQNIHKSIFNLILKHNCKTTPQKFIYEIPIDVKIIEDKTSNQYYEIPVEETPSNLRSFLYQIPLQKSVVIDEGQVCEYLNRFDSFKNLPPKIHNHFIQLSNNKQFFRIPVKLDGVHASSQTQIEPLENLDKLSIVHENSDKDLEDIDDTLVRMKDMIKNLSRKTSQYSNEYSSAKCGDESNQVKLDFKYTRGISENYKKNSSEKDEKKQIKIKENNVEKNKSFFSDFTRNCCFIEVQPKTIETKTKQNEEQIPLYEAPVEIKTNAPELCFIYQVCQVTLNPSSRNVDQFQKENQSLYLSLTPLNFKKIGQNVRKDGNFAQKKRDTSRSMKKSKNKSHCYSPLTHSRDPVYISDAESSEGSRTERDNYISEMQGNSNIELKLQENFNLKQTQFQIQQLYDLKDKLMNSQEEKAELFQKLRRSEHQIKILTDEVNSQKESAFLEEDKLKSANICLTKLQSQKQEKCKKIFELIETKNILEEKISHILSELKGRQDQIEQIQSRFQAVENQYLKEMQKLSNEIIQKDNVLKQFEKQQYFFKNYYQSEIDELLRVNQEFKTTIDEQTKQIQRKKNKIEEQKISINELMEQFQHACKEKDQLPSLIHAFAKQYQKVKDEFDHQISLKNNNISELEIENMKLNNELKQQKSVSKQFMEALTQNKQMANHLRLEIKGYKKQINNQTKLGMSSHVEAELDYLRRELVSTREQAEIRDLKIRELSVQLKNKKDSEENFEIQFLKDGGDIIYIEQLKDIITNYEKIILSHHSMIKELQSQVYQYLTDALQKEDEAQNLHETILNYETDMNDLMLEKIAVQLENKKLKRSMKVSQRKISTLGNRMIVAAREKNNDEDSFQLDPKLRKSVKKAQNSTIKLGLDI